jgi:hypothetical protein
MSTRNVLIDVKERLAIAVSSLGNEHHLSDWERGQVDGLYWAKQIIDEMLEMEEEKTPLAGES